MIIPQRSDPDGSKARQNAGVPSRSRTESDRGTNEVETDKRGTLTHTVYPGQRLGSIARRYHVSISALCKANGIRRTDIIKPGQELIVPGHSDESGGSEARPGDVPRAHQSSKPQRATQRSHSWAPYAKSPWRKGYVEVVGHHASWKGYLVGAKRRVLPAARRAVSRVMAWPHKDKRMDSRLLGLLSQVSNTFGGRTLRVVSGWRMTSFARESRHRLGRAVDFRVVGVPNEVLRDYLRTFANVGIGYYPNSTFVHLDVRDTSAYWVDYAGPGEPPRYAKPVSADDESSESRESAGTHSEGADTVADAEPEPDDETPHAGDGTPPSEPTAE